MCAAMTGEKNMDAYTTHGAFSWCELATTDVAAAKEFYAKLFGWSLRDMDMPGGKYTTAQVGETSVAGIMDVAADSPPRPPSWGCYVTVKNVDETLKLAEQLGAKVCLPAMEIPNVGRMAVIADPQGAMLSVITYSMPT
jgi:predicted enzyme related to lactoylglutathione lyase